MQQEKKSPLQKTPCHLRPSPEFSIAMVRYPNAILTLIFELLIVNYITVIQMCMFIYKNTQGGEKVGSCLWRMVFSTGTTQKRWLGELPACE